MLESFFFLGNCDIFVFYSSLITLGIASVIGRKSNDITYILILGIAISASIIALLDSGDAWNYSFEGICRAILYGLLTICLFTSRFYITGTNTGEKELYFLAIWSTLGLSCCMSVDSLVGLFVGIELYSIPVYAMCAFGADIKSAESGVKAFLFGAFASALLMMSIALMYTMTGSLDIQTVTQKMTTFDSSQVSIILVLFLSAFIIKIGIAPLHLWAPDVYQGAPLVAMHFIATVSKFGLGSIMLWIISSGFFQIHLIKTAMLYTGILSVLIGSLSALLQSNIRRILAMSSVAHMGYVLMGTAMGAYSETLLYLIVYSFTTSGFITLIYAVKSYNLPVQRVKDIAGIIELSPVRSTGIAVLLLSMAGIPPFAGFFAKFYIFASMAQHQEYVIIGLSSIASVIAVAYYLRIIGDMFFYDLNPGLTLLEDRNSLIVGMAIMASAAVFMFFAWDMLYFINYLEI